MIHIYNQYIQNSKTNKRNETHCNCLESADKQHAPDNAYVRRNRKGWSHTQARHTFPIPVIILPHEYNRNNSMVI